MTKTLKNKLIGEYKKAFQGTYEKGGGYNFRFYHGLRVMKYCEKFLQLDYFKKKTIDKDALLVAALFHDIGKVQAVDKFGEIQYSSKSNKEHERIGANLIHKYISKYIKDQEITKSVEKIIGEQHQQQTTIESKLVMDTDRFDNYGFIQIWRHITHAHQSKRNIDQVFEYWFEENGRVEAKDSLKEFNYPVIRKLAKNRFEKLDHLILGIKRETEGLDIK
jgi:putative nucleotidyltransferase with HDIG domain